MPAKSGKQLRLMYAAASGGLKGMGGPSPEVARHFISETPRDKKKSLMSETKKTGKKMAGK